MYIGTLSAVRYQVGFLHAVPDVHAINVQPLKVHKLDLAIVCIPIHDG